MAQRRIAAVAVGVTLLLLALWRGTFAARQPAELPAHAQIWRLSTSLAASEAEQVLGSYIPGVGAVVSIHLLRGPNTDPEKSSYTGTRDWSIYVMREFGPRLTAVPPEELIAFSIDFYDYEARIWHQLLVRSRAGDVTNPEAYQILLDGRPFDEAAAALDAASAARGAVGPPVIPTPPLATPTLEPTGVPLGQSEPVSVTLSFAGDESATSAWAPTAGRWLVSARGYEQAEVERFDLISFYNRPVFGPVRLRADVRYLGGRMGAGLVFGAPSGDEKAGATIVSYTADGAYLQWGAFDAEGVFQFQGGTEVPSGADGELHHIEVRVREDRYDVLLDGEELARDVPREPRPEQYVGLLASTSHVVFERVELESLQP